MISKDILSSICKYINNDHKSMSLFEIFGVDLKHYTSIETRSIILKGRTKFQMNKFSCKNIQELKLLENVVCKELDLNFSDAIINKKKINKLPNIKLLKTLKLVLSESFVFDETNFENLAIRNLTFTHHGKKIFFPKNLIFLNLISKSSASRKNIILPEKLQVCILDGCYNIIGLPKKLKILSCGGEHG